MVRGCLLLLIGLVLGAGLMLAWWPRPPAGVSAPRAPDVRVFISDSYLTRSIGRRVAGMQLPTIHKVRIASNPPQSLIMRCELSIGPLSAPAALEIAPVVDNGHVQVRVVSTEVAGIPVPGLLTGLLADAINSRINGLPGGNGRVTGVRVLRPGVEISASFP